MKVMDSAYKMNGDELLGLFLVLGCQWVSFLWAVQMGKSVC